MREILFRGKRVDNGEWVYGYLYITHNGEYEIGCYNKTLDIERVTHIVIPETVGQYTGLTDRNGKKIFEGDIVRYHIWYDYDITAAVVKIGEYQEEVNQAEYTTICYGVYAEVVKYELPEWADDFPDYARTLNLLSACKDCECEVIGTVADNPELLEVE